MAKYQIHLIVDIEAADDNDAYDTAERLGDFLGMHHLTTTAGTVTEVNEIDETDAEEDIPATDDAALDDDTAFDVESLVEVAHAMDDTDFLHAE